MKPAQNHVVIVGMLFSAFYILSNLTGFKLVQYSDLTFPAGLIFFPLTYIFDDILTEVYGFKISRRIIWTALFANTIIVVGTLITVYLPPASFWQEQNAYATVYHAVPRVFIGSTVAYLIGEFINSIILAKLKVRMQGHYLWLRAITSTAIGVCFDTVLFVHIAFLGLIPYSVVWHIIFTMYLCKVTYEILAVPITCKVANYLKNKDQVDHYDVTTKFNPFSIAVD